MASVIDEQVTEQQARFVPVGQLGRAQPANPIDAQILQVLGAGEDFQGRAIYLIPLLSDQALDACQEEQAERQLEAFMRECMTCAVKLDRRELGFNYVGTEGRTSRYDMAEIWNVLHPTWRDYYKDLRNQPLTPERLEEVVAEIVKRPPFSLASDRFATLRPTHFFYAVQRIPKEVRAQEMEPQLKLAVDENLTTFKFLRHLKKRYGTTKTEEPEDESEVGGHVTKDAELRLARQEARIYREEAETAQRQRDEYKTKLEALTAQQVQAIDVSERLDDLSQEAIVPEPFNQHLLELEADFEHWLADARTMAREHGASGLLNMQDQLADSYEKFFDRISAID